jgi:hypothetical protein
MGLGSGIRKKIIPNPGVKKAPDPDQPFFKVSAIKSMSIPYLISITMI